ncbi:MAG TPA: serine hydrolase domain-containing protein, partial [Polyangia bacterium]|nr:serine hydrolase domain-containing protein [Polyangia bacterium]
ASAQERSLDPARLADLELMALPDGADPSPTPGDLQALRGRIADIVSQYRAPGAAVAVVGPRGELLIEGFGRAGEERAMDAGSLFRVGSITKSFLSLAVMRLVEQGKLRLDDRVQALAPEIAIDNPFERTHPLRVAHLLEHTSGFDEMRFNEIFDSPAGGDRPLREVLAVNPRSRVCRWEPGTRFSYSQPGYTTAAYLVEKASGMPYARYLEEEVFAPLGIRASVRLTDEVRGRLAQGHDEGQPRPYVHLLHRPSMNLMISAHGMSRLLQMLLGRGTIEGRRFLSPESVERIERSGTLPYGPSSVRYGLGNWGDASSPVPTRGHGGFMPGYNAFYRYSTARRFGFAVLVNDSEGWDTVGPINKVIFQYLLRDNPPAAPPEQRLPRSALLRWVGHYRLAAPEVEFLRYVTDLYAEIEVEEQDGVLFMTDLRRHKTRPLVATGPDTFRGPRESESSVQFIRDGRGRRAVIVGQTYFQEEAAWWAALKRWAMELALLLVMSTGWIPIFLALRRRLDEALVLVRPLLAALCLWGMSVAFEHAMKSGDLGSVTGTTVTVWLLSWAFALCSYSALTAAREAGREVVRSLRVYAFAVSAAAVWITLYLSRYGLIGLRTWRW